MKVRAMLFLILTVNFQSTYQCMRYPARLPHSKVFGPNTAVPIQPKHETHQGVFEGVVKKIRKLEVESHKGSNDNVNQEPTEHTTKTIDETTQTVRLYLL